MKGCDDMKNACTCDHHHEHDQHGCSCGHDHHHDHGCSCGHHHEEHTGRTLAVRAALTIGLLAAGQCMPSAWMGIPLRVAAYLISGYDVLLTALRNICRGRVFDENFLMAVASLGAMLVGESAEGVMVMLLYQLGEYLQHRAVNKSRTNIAALMDVRPETATLLEDGKPVTVKPEDVPVGACILVRPGEKIPLDGVIEEGASALDTAALTGESMPRDVAVGDSVLSGCVNLTGVLTIRVTAEYHQSTVAKILDLVAKSGSEISPEHQEKIFHKFYQADESHVSEGNGVGLAVVKKIVQLHDGAVAVHDETGMVTFVVTLPKGL